MLENPVAITSRTYLVCKCEPSGPERSKVQATLLYSRKEQAEATQVRSGIKLHFLTFCGGPKPGRKKCTFLILFCQAWLPHCSKWDTSCYQCSPGLILRDIFWFWGFCVGCLQKTPKGFPKSRIQNLVSIKKAAWSPGAGIKNSPRDSLLSPGHPFWGKHFFAPSPVWFHIPKTGLKDPSTSWHSGCQAPSSELDSQMLKPIYLW